MDEKAGYQLAVVMWGKGCSGGGSSVACSTQGFLWRLVNEQHAFGGGGGVRGKEVHMSPSGASLWSTVVGEASFWFMQGNPTQPNPAQYNPTQKQ